MLDAAGDGETRVQVEESDGGDEEGGSYYDGSRGGEVGWGTGGGDLCAWIFVVNILFIHFLIFRVEFGE